ncbi:YbjN domain-containing protein [Tessaracoccus sp. HDW20]|uniref:T3SS (YopN, CesT) and YbjN peptide-binding chaperone 1 n=1 Tax=Tessaracoccus coleopterorum TaxID=2714950 RepID=UPI0018D30BF1|nr:YbjN domain-containing protein [Tessaracoccus coleopterorum]
MGRPNPGEPWFHTVVSQEESARLARLATETLAAVFGVLHPIFLEPDQLAEILKGESTWIPLEPRPLGKDEVSVRTASKAELDRLVDEVLRARFGHPALRNEQGDVAIRVGSTMVFLRSTDDAAELILFSPLVHDVSGRSRACEVLNDLNVEARFGRFSLHRDRVFVQLSVPAQPFVPAHLYQALHILSQIADGIDDELADRLGGRTTFQSL